MTPKAAEGQEKQDRIGERDVNGFQGKERVFQEVVKSKDSPVFNHAEDTDYNTCDAKQEREPTKQKQSGGKLITKILPFGLLLSILIHKRIIT